MELMNEIIKHEIYTIDDFWSYDKCNDYIKNINLKNNIVNFTSNGTFKNDKYIDVNLSTSLYKKLQESIGMEIIEELKIIGANSIIMTGKYNKDQQFGIHTDTGLYYNKIKKEASRYTLLIYLNDDFNGGETVFYNGNFNEITIIKPKKGMALLFDINKFHKGNIVEYGTKYWLGCEIVAKF